MAMAMLNFSCRASMDMRSAISARVGSRQKQRARSHNGQRQRTLGTICNSGRIKEGRVRQMREKKTTRVGPGRSRWAAWHATRTTDLSLPVGRRIVSVFLWYTPNYGYSSRRCCFLEGRGYPMFSSQCVSGEAPGPSGPGSVSISFSECVAW
jgi:hypothetical protein